MKNILFSSVIFYLFSAVVVYSEGSEKGILIVSTYPISAMVNVDGENKGKAPITVSLDKGDHTISFSDHSSQYATPPDRIIQIKAGEKFRITGVYENRYVPREPPNNFQPADSLLIYGLKDRPQKNGLIFDYIDGGAIVYLRHGLRETTHVSYNRPGGSTLTLDIYDMGTPGGSKAGFDDEQICPGGFGKCDIEAPCKTYHYEPDYYLYFHKSNYLVYISTNNDSLKSSVESFAALVSRNIQ